MSENPATSAAANETEDLRQQMASLRAVILKLQYSLIAFSWIIGVYLFIQVWRSYKEVKTFRPQISQVLEVTKRDQAAIAQFIGKLGEYGRSHSDVRPILSKYGIPIAQAPAPAPAADPKAAAVPASMK